MIEKSLCYNPKRMLHVALLCIGILALFQVGVLFFCWRHRRDPLLILPREQRSQVFIHLLNIRSSIEAINLLTGALLSKSYGPMNLSHLEFIHQIEKHCHEAEGSLGSLVAPDQPLAMPATETQSSHQDPLRDHLQRERKKHPTSPQ